jgi:hypothetical protein
MKFHLIFLDHFILRIFLLFFLSFKIISNLTPLLFLIGKIDYLSIQINNKEKLKHSIIRNVYFPWLE